MMEFRTYISCVCNAIIYLNKDFHKAKKLTYSHTAVHISIFCNPLKEEDR